MQFRSDPEFEEARINDLEDLVLQLQDRVESLERSVVQLRSLFTPTENVMAVQRELKAIEKSDGQQIAKAIKAME